MKTFKHHFFNSLVLVWEEENGIRHYYVNDNRVEFWEVIEKDGISTLTIKKYEEMGNRIEKIKKTLLEEKNVIKKY